MIDLPFIAVNSGTGGGGGGGDTIITGHVATYANLPAASGYTGQYYIVDTNTGTWLLGTLKKAGLYKSNGTTWVYIDNVPETTSLSDGTTVITGTNIILEGTNGVVTTTDVNNNKITISGPNIPDQLSDLSDDSTHRLVTDTEKTTWNNKLGSYTETDPVFLASQANNITSTHITTLNNTSGTNTGDETNTSIISKIGYTPADAQISDRIYDGVDLSTKFASKIAASPYNGDVWAWIKARIQAGNFDGIHVGDYIPFTLSNGTISDGDTSYSITSKTLNAVIAGIDTYKGYGDSEVGHHIDFISSNCIGTNIPFNKSNHNNGSSTYQNPFMASKIYACLNGIDNTATGYNSTAYGYDASSGGVFQLLPEALRNVIIGKRVYAEKRYSASGDLTEANGREWETWGTAVDDNGTKRGLWLPREAEIYGYPIHATGGKEAYSGLCNELIGGFVQYPLFAGCAGKPTRDKNRLSWWLSSVASGSSSHACLVHGNGCAYATECTSTTVSVPVCFRIG